MIYARKYRIYPTKEQSVFLDKTLAAARFVYNLALETRITAYKESLRFRPSYNKEGVERGISLSAYDLSKQLTELKKNPEAIWLTEVHSIPLISAIQNMDTAYKNFFKTRADFPRFRSKHKTQTFQFHQGYEIDEANQRIKIAKLDEKIKIKMHRPLGGKPKTCTISKTRTGKYFLSVQVEADDVIMPKEDVKNAVGIDVNTGSFDLSDGAVYDLPRAYRKAKNRLAFLDRQMRRKKKGSKNREKARLRLAKQHEKVANIRKDFLHKLSHQLVTSDYDTICIEDLNVKGMMAKAKPQKREDGKGYKKNGRKRKAGLSKSLADAGFGEFRRQLEYKSEWYGKNLLLAPRFEPTSKKCSNCGYINKDLNLSQRRWDCPECGTTHRRDTNAAVNIMRAALENNGYEGRQTPGLPVEGSGYAPSEAGMVTYLTTSKEHITGVTPTSGS